MPNRQQVTLETALVLMAEFERLAKNRTVTLTTEGFDDWVKSGTLTCRVDHFQGYEIVDCMIDGCSLPIPITPAGHSPKHRKDVVSYFEVSKNTIRIIYRDGRGKVSWRHFEFN